MQPVIQVQHLSFSYPDGRQALQDINLSVMPGEKIALLGANGAGKSTLIFHLNGIFSGQGQILIDGLEVNKKNMNAVRARVGIVFQQPDDQLFSASVFDDVAYGPIYQGFDRQSVQEKVEQALQAVKLEGYAGRNPYHLSGGEKKRAAIASVLSMQPPILVLDEPTAGLDPRSRRELIELLRELPQTMLIATHDLEMARSLLARAVVMNGGRIVADGASADILSNEALLFENGLS